MVQESEKVSLTDLAHEAVELVAGQIAAQGVEGLAFAVPSKVLKDFLYDRDAFAFDVRNPNAGFRYNSPPPPASVSTSGAEE